MDQINSKILWKKTRVLYTVQNALNIHSCFFVTFVYSRFRLTILVDVLIIIIFFFFLMYEPRSSVVDFCKVQVFSFHLNSYLCIFAHALCLQLITGIYTEYWCRKWKKQIFKKDSLLPNLSRVNTHDHVCSQRKPRISLECVCLDRNELY